MAYIANFDHVAKLMSLDRGEHYARMKLAAINVQVGSADTRKHVLDEHLVWLDLRIM